MIWLWCNGLTFAKKPLSYFNAVQPKKNVLNEQALINMQFVISSSLTFNSFINVYMLIKA